MEVWSQLVLAPLSQLVLIGLLLMVILVLVTTLAKLWSMERVEWLGNECR